MADFIARYIDAAIPLTVGVLALFFPRALTKKDLTKPENEKTARTLRNAGRWLIAIGLVLAIVSAFQHSKG
jgi:hypothetical protein